MNFNASRDAHTSLSETRVLIVDDEPNVATSIQGVLRLIDINATVALGGRAALEELQDNSYDILLLDLKMPEISGMDVLDFINMRKIDVNIIVISGEAEIRKAVNALKNGARDYIRKPFGPEELTFSIKNVLEKVKLEKSHSEMLEQIEESEALHRFMVHNSPDLLYMLDQSGTLVFVNKSATKLLGYSRKELIGKHYTELIHPKDIERAGLFFKRGLRPRNGRNLELRLKGSDDQRVIHVAIRAINIRKQKSKGFILSRQAKGFVGICGVARDITEHKKSQQLIRYQYDYDLLTGLPNRTLLKEQLDSLIIKKRSNRLPFAVLCIDIKRFKLINDSYGQSIGDSVLQELAVILSRCTRDSDIVARLSNDEFIVVLPDIDSVDDAITVVNKISAAVTIPFRYAGHEIYINLSAGIALFPEHGRSADDLINCADIATCNAGANQHCIYRPSQSNGRSKVTAENTIRDALKHDRFVVHYQPQIDIASSTIHAAEALIRINNCDNELIMPGSFIDVAEETGQINEIGDAVLARVCEDMRYMNSRGLKLRICINISAIQLNREDFAAHFLDTIAVFGLRGDQFEVELTESAIVQNMNRTITNFEHLTEAGVNVAIDDFGTGYSSLSYLDHLPLKTLKLDRSFMKKITAENSEDSIIPAMISVAKGLKLDFIAEGVETSTQHHYLRKLGRCIAQGFYYSKPLTRDNLMQFGRKYYAIGDASETS